MPKKILDEDAYVNALEVIIQKHYFPHLPQLRAMKEYLNALENNDYEQMRTATLNYGQLLRKLDMSQTRETISHRSSILHSPQSIKSIYNSPSNHNQFDMAEASDSQFSDWSHIKPSLIVNSEPNTLDNISLDDFLTNFISQDNASFHSLMYAAKETLRQKYWWAFNPTMAIQQRKHTAITAPKSSSAVQNELDEPISEYIAPSLVSLNAPTKTSIINYSNTRIDDQPTLDNTSISTNYADALQNTIKSKQSSSASAYGYVYTPTPMRQDGSETPFIGADFKMPEFSEREQAARSLQNKAKQRQSMRRSIASRQASARSAASTPRAAGSIRDNVASILRKV